MVYIFNIGEDKRKKIPWKLRQRRHQTAEREKKSRDWKAIRRRALFIYQLSFTLNLIIHFLGFKLNFSQSIKPNAFLRSLKSQSFISIQAIVEILIVILFECHNLRVTFWSLVKAC